MEGNREGKLCSGEIYREFGDRAFHLERPASDFESYLFDGFRDLIYDF